MKFGSFIFASLAMLVAPAFADIGIDGDDMKLVSTPGYFIDKRGVQTGTGVGYHDYAAEKAYGVTPSLSPYVPNGASFSKSLANTTVFTVKDPGRYVDSWILFVHGADPATATAERTIADNPESLAVTYAMLPSASNLDLVPLLKMINYTLAYDPDGGVWYEGLQPEARQLVWSNAVVFAGADLCGRTGYTFTGWNTKKDGSGVAIAAGREASGSDDGGGKCLGVSGNGEKVTLYAQWKANEYDLDLEPGAGVETIFYRVGESGGTIDSALPWKTVTAATTVKVEYGALWQAYAAVKPGYAYSATSAKKPASGVMGVDGAAFEPSAEANKIQLVYEGNGKTSGTMSSTTYVYDEPFYLPETTYERVHTVTFDPDYAGAGLTSAAAKFLFSGWQDDSGRYIYSDHACVTNPCSVTEGTVILHAQWKITKPVTLPNPARDGMSFLGWYSRDEEGKETKIGDAGEVYYPQSDIRLYGKWTEKGYTVRFIDSQDNGLFYQETVAYGDAATLPTPPLHEGLVFTGWSTDAYKKVTSDLEIKALYGSGPYKVCYTSNYRNDLEEETLLSEGCGSDSASLKITLLDAEGAGFANSKAIFLGWSWRSDASSPDFAAGSELLYTKIAERADETGIAKLYAVWKDATYTVTFLANGGGGSMTTQLFDAGVTQNLFVNRFTCEGYVFAGWATEAGGDVAYADREELTLTSDLELYAVWEPNTYTILFNTGVDGVTGTLQPLTNCVYGEEIKVSHSWSKDFAYNNPGAVGRERHDKTYAQGFCGWAAEPGGEIVIASPENEYVAEYATNLTAEADGVVTLFAVWGSSGPLSDAIGLHNAVLTVNDPVDNYQWCAVTNSLREGGVSIELVNTETPGYKEKTHLASAVKLTTILTGPGSLSFEHFQKAYGGGTQEAKFTIVVDDKAINLPKVSAWTNNVISITGDSEHTVCWQLHGAINNGANADQVGLANIRWTPLASSATYPEYKLTYTGVQTTAGLPTAYTVNSDDIVFPMLADTAEYRFKGWSPAMIYHGTTGDITVKALWEPKTTSHSVVFSIGGGVHTGGGELAQTVEHGSAAKAPKVTPPSGRVFVGWDCDFSCVTDDLQVKALYSVTAYPVLYVGTKGAENPNPSSYTVGEELALEPLADATGFRFTGWIPEKIPATAVGDFAVTATWERATHAITIDGKTKSCAYGDQATFSTFASKLLEGGTTNIVCTGFAGTGSVPASGATNSVTFTVTGDGGIDWIYCTNYWVEVVPPSNGAIEIRDPNGYLVTADAFWAAAGKRYTFNAIPEGDYVFCGWNHGQFGEDVDSFVFEEPMTLTAEFAVNPLYVEFTAGEHLEFNDESTVKTVKVAPGSCAFAPTVVAEEGWEFAGWDRTFDCVRSDITVTALATQTVHTVVFELGEYLTRTGGGELRQGVVHGAAATAPAVVAAEHYAFAGWEPAAFTKITSDLLVEGSVVRTEYHAVASASSSVGGTVTGGDVWLASGKSVKFTAKAKKGYFFKGWYDAADGGLVSENAEFKFDMPEADVEFVARFVTADEDAASVRAEVNGLALFGEGVEKPIVLVPSASVKVGLYLEWTLAMSSAASVTVSGLPSGLKFTAKGVVDRKTKAVTVPAMTIYGAPTAGGKTSTVKFTFKTASKTKVVATMKLKVEALPTEIIGTFTGGSTNDPAGSASIKLAKSGKVSGKWISAGKTWTVSAARLSGWDEESDVFSADAVFKNGKTSETVKIFFSVAESGYGIAQSELFEAAFVNWKVEPFKTIAKTVKGDTFLYEEDGVKLSGKVGASGAVTVTGSFDVGAAKPYTAKAKGTLVPFSDDGFMLFLYYPPNARKNFPGWTRLLEIPEN